MEITFEYRSKIVKDIRFQLFNCILTARLQDAYVATETLWGVK